MRGDDAPDGVIMTASGRQVVGRQGDGVILTPKGVRASKITTSWASSSRRQGPSGAMGVIPTGRREARSVALTRVNSDERRMTPLSSHPTPSGHQQDDTAPRTHVQVWQLPAQELVESVLVVPPPHQWPSNPRLRLPPAPVLGAIRTQIHAADVREDEFLPNHALKRHNAVTGA